jgi:hypothetical protein
VAVRVVPLLLDTARVDHVYDGAPQAAAG